VETATFGSEFVAGRICVEQVIDVRNTLRYLGVPIREKSFLFGDNTFFVDSYMEINAKHYKRHIMLYFHRVREDIAAGIVSFHFLLGDDNLSDILSKHWGYTQMKERLNVLLFWKGDTADMKKGDPKFQAKEECRVISTSSRGIPGVSRTPFHGN
jgi:hypothetical protein